MIDFLRRPAATGGPVDEPLPSFGQGAIDHGSMAAELGREIAGPLTSALERVNALATTGKIDRSGLAALRLEIESARRAGMLAQQLGRLAGRRIQEGTEQLDLTQLVRDALAQRAREAVARDVEIRQALHPAQVLADGSSLFSLVQALLDWAFALATRRVDFKVDVKPWPVEARLACRFMRTAAPIETQEGQTMAWRLVEQLSRSMGLVLQREDAPDQTRLTIEFPRTVNEQMEGVSAIELDQGFAPSLNSKPLAGSHVLVVASRREVRVLVRDAIRAMGLMVDFTTSVEEAREFCNGGLPHAVVYESALGGDRFAALQRELLTELPSLAFIAIGEDGRDYESTVDDGHILVRIGREAILASLPSALLFGLSRGIEA